MKSKELRRSVLVALLLAALGAGLWPQAAGAQSSTCRTDPVITLTNLQTLDVGANINDAGTDVAHVTYVVHVPKGTSPVLTVSYTLGFSGRESLYFYADNPPGVYDTYVTVSTFTSGVSVSAYTSVSLLPTLGTRTVYGTSNQTLHVRLAPTL